MTFADWRHAYPGIHVSPMADAPEVYHVTGRDPLEQGAAAVFDPPMRALFDLTDYKVTSDNPHRGSVFVAPRVERDDWTRADYMAHRIDHETYYLSLARLIGYERIARMVLGVFGRDAIVQAFGTDPHMNNLPLSKWDALDPAIRGAVSEQNKTKRIMDRSWCGQPLRPGTICWSLSESVCVAKAVARHIALGTEA